MRRISRLLVQIVVIALAIGFGVFVYAAWLSFGRGEPIKITVAAGDKLADVTDKLIAGGIFSSRFGYRLYSFLDSSAARPKAGGYFVRYGTSYRSIARTLARGPEREEVAVTLIEGKTLDDEAKLLESFGVKPEAFWAIAGKSKNALPFSRELARSYPFLADAPKASSLEGYLFPETYRVWQDEPSASLVAKQLNEFQKRVIEPYEEERRASGLTWHEIVTLASIVEVEVRAAEDRKIVAGIFLRRLKEKMRLQTDAALDYYLDSGRSRATAKDLAADTPYNTYLYAGLPPGPIGNPGLESIRAVLEPTRTVYRFFLTDKEGKVRYARTYEEHLANKRRAY